MKYLVLFFFLITVSTHAQFVSMNAKEISTLKKLIRENSSVTQHYLKFKLLADASLDLTPAAIDTVFSEGRLASDPKKIKSLLALQDVSRMYALAITYTVEGSEIYLNKARDFLLNWATINKPMENPINDTRFEPAFESYDLVKNNLTVTDNETIKNWFRTMAYKELNHPFFSKKNIGPTTTNWNSHRLKVIGMIGYAIDDYNLIKFIDTALPSQVASNLCENGAGIDFEERDALHYQVYTLEPLVRLAIVVNRASGHDFYNFVSSQGSSIKKSMEFLLPYTTGEKTHQEFRNSTAPFDLKRAQNKESSFTTGALYQPTHGLHLFSMATYFDENYLKIVQHLENTEEKYPNWEVVINHVYGKMN